MYVDAARHTANSATPIPGRGMRDLLQSDGWPPRNRATGAHESERPPADRFEALAAWSQRAEADSADIAAALLASSATAFDTVCDVLRPLWAEEAFHRAYSLLRLNAARLRPCRDMPAMQQDIALARRLAAGFRALAADRDAAMVPCSPILHDVVQTLGLLFGSATGRVQVTINIARMMLPAYKRRALVLAASELVVNALTHAFGPGDRGRIHVSLLRRSADNACLLVADDGRGFGRGVPDPAESVAAALANLLESDLVYDRTAVWATVAGIAFPLPAASGRVRARICHPPRKHSIRATKPSFPLADTKKWRNSAKNGRIRLENVAM